jgi:hypothetical protein
MGTPPMNLTAHRKQAMKGKLKRDLTPFAGLPDLGGILMG